MNQENAPQLDCIVRVITPENIEFDYMLAGPFQRMPAFAADWAIRIAVAFALMILMSFVGIFGLGLGYLGLALLLIAFFLLSWLYGVLMETYCNGRTLGKMMFRLRVISADGRPISGSQAALRNLIRLCDMFPPAALQVFSPELESAQLIPTFLFGLIATTMTVRMQRLGDLAAGTMVVSDRRRGVSTNLQPEDVRAYSLAEHIPPTFQISRTLARVVALYMERRRLLHPIRRAELAAYIAEPLIKEFGLLPDTSTDLLMCALYVRIYHSQTQREESLLKTRVIKPVQLQSSPFVTVMAPSPSYDVQVVATGTMATPMIPSNPIRPPSTSSTGPMAMPIPAASSPQEPDARASTNTRELP